MEVFSFSLYFLILGPTSQVFSKVIHSFLGSVIIGTPPRPYLRLIVFSFNFQSFGNHPRSYLYLFFILVVYYWNTIQVLSKFIFLFLHFFHHWDRFLGSIEAHSFFPLITSHWEMIIWFLIVWTPSRFYGSFFFLPLFSHIGADIIGFF